MFQDVAFIVGKDADPRPQVDMSVKRIRLYYEGLLDGAAWAKLYSSLVDVHVGNHVVATLGMSDLFSGVELLMPILLSRNDTTPVFTYHDSDKLIEGTVLCHGIAEVEVK